MEGPMQNSRMQATIILSLLQVLGVVWGEECERACPDTYRPICASDDVTYTNWCYLEEARCRSGGLQELYFGECGCHDYRKCEMTYSPVCGTDHNTHVNTCTFNVAKACTSNVTVEMAHEGRCAPDPGDPLCKSDVICAMNYAPVCGSDGRTYSNSCAVQAQNTCRMENDKVEIAYVGKCQDQTQVWMWVALVSIALLLLLVTAFLIHRYRKRRRSRTLYDDDKTAAL